MDGSQFDAIVQFVLGSRRSLRASVLAASGFLVRPEVDAARAEARGASDRHDVNIEKKRKSCKR